MTGESVRPLGYGRQTISDEDVRAVVECLASDYLTQGPRVAAFEEALCQATGACFAVAVANGTAALHLAYLAMGLGPGDLGVTTAISFVATSNGLLYAGSDVGFADVDRTTGLICLEDLGRLVDSLVAERRPPKVIVPVDLAGQPVDRLAIQTIASRCGARILEDAAHSLGATYQVDGTTFRVGGCAHADAAILSFHPVKHVTTGEGGAVLTNDPDLAGRLRDLRTHGIHKDANRFTRPVTDPFVGPWYYEQSALGFNYRITDIQCALGVSQMKRLDEFVSRRQEIARRYDEALTAEPLSKHLTPLRRLPSRTHAHHLYVVQLGARDGEASESVAARRKELYSRLADQQIHCQVHYIPIPWQPHYATHPGVARRSLPGAEAYYASSLSIPMYPAMSDDDVDRVVRALERACSST